MATAAGLALGVAAATAFGAVGAAPACEFVRPPMGWNSYDSGLGGGDNATNESVVVRAASFLSRHLLSAGYEYVILDAGWFGPNDGSTMSLDEHGRLVPCVERYPSSSAGRGFGPLAKVVHGLGLRFGFWIMGGIPRDAVRGKLPIEGSNYTADEAADLTGKRDCGWQPGFVYGSRLTDDGRLHPAAVAYYESLARLYKSWNVDYIKMDCVFGDDYHRGKEDSAQFAASMASQQLRGVLSLSPGSDAGMASVGRAFAELDHERQPTMARMTGDFWDSWSSLYGHFEVAAQAANFTGGGFYPDLDMLPIGWVWPYEAKARYARFSSAEARSLITLMVMARAPMIWGGSATEELANATTLGLLSQREVLDVARSSCGNHQWRRGADNIAIWTARGRTQSLSYVALFNLGDNATDVEVSLDDLIPEARHHGITARDLWNSCSFPVEENRLVAHLQPQASLLLRLRSEQMDADGPQPRIAVHV